MKMSKGVVLTLGVVGLIVVIAGVSSCRSNSKEVINIPREQSSTNASSKSEADAEQERLVKRFGEAPEGFKWDDNGDLLALGDASLTAEEVAYTYLKSASLLDFEMLQKVSLNSKVSEKYQSFSENTDNISDFKKKMYKESLKSIKVNSLVDTAVYAQGKTTFTFSINVLDLSNKDFWKKDSEKLFNNIYTYKRTEDDSTKAKSYLYSYILETYTSEQAPKHSVELELTVSKNDSGAWLVSDDNALNSLCLYEDGEFVSDHILAVYDDWYQEKLDGK
jgi:hypothetical protein